MTGRAVGSSRLGHHYPLDLDSVRTGRSAETIAEAMVDNLRYVQAKLPERATLNDWYMALAFAVRDRMLDGYIATLERFASAGPRTKAVAYLCAEFLTGPHLANALINLGLWNAARKAVEITGNNLFTLLDQEEEPGLGSGGLGRLAACY